MSPAPDSARILAVDLEKRYDRTGPVPFAPARSLYSRLTGRRHAVATGTGGDPWLDDDEELEDDEFEEAASGAERSFSPVGAREYAIRDVSFELEPGIVAGLLGGPGSGKTTLIRLLAGVSVPTGGRALLRGVVMPPPQLLSAFMRPDLSAGQNLRLAARLFGIPRRVVRHRSEHILDLAGMHRRTPIEPRSAGEAFRRLGMAMAIGAAPDVLLLDEIPSLSDEQFATRFVEALGQLAEDGATVLLATRSDHAASLLCERVLVLHEGRLQSGTHTAPADERNGAGSDAGIRRSASLPEPEATGEMLARRELRPGGRTHPLLPPGKPGWPGIGFHQWAALLTVRVRDATGAPVERLAVDQELIVEFGIETGVRALDVHWSVLFLADDGNDISVEEEAPRRYGERTVSEMTVRIAPGTLRPGAYVGRVEGLISAAGRTYTIRRDAFGLVVEGDPEVAPGELEPLGPVVVDRSASTWSLRGVLPPDALIRSASPDQGTEGRHVT